MLRFDSASPLHESQRPLMWPNLATTWRLLCQPYLHSCWWDAGHDSPSASLRGRSHCSALLFSPLKISPKSLSKSVFNNQLVRRCVTGQAGFHSHAAISGWLAHWCLDTHRNHRHYVARAKSDVTAWLTMLVSAAEMEYIFSEKHFTRCILALRKNWISAFLILENCDSEWSFLLFEHLF